MLDILNKETDKLNIKQFKHGASKELFVYFISFSFEQLEEAKRNAKSADLWQVLGIINDVIKHKNITNAISYDKTLGPIQSPNK